MICLPQTMAMPPVTGKDSTSLVVSVPNKPGAVHDLLVPLKKNGVSLTRFESRPAKSGQWEYYFYMDIAGHPAQPAVAAALNELKERAASKELVEDGVEVGTNCQARLALASDEPGSVSMNFSAMRWRPVAPQQPPRFSAAAPSR